MKLLKKDRKQLEQVLASLKEGLAYLMQDNMAIMMETNSAASDVFTSTYYPGKKYAKCCKDMGSKFCYALTAMQELTTLLAQKPVQLSDEVL